MSAYLLLGRAGDILSVLPFLRAEVDTGDKPTLIVSNQQTSVLEGVSYVNVVAFDGGLHLLREAYAWAKEKFPDVKSLQVMGHSDVVREVTYGPAGKPHATCTSFVKEMWSLAGKLGSWDECWPLVFDQRNPKRETALVKSVDPANRKTGGRPPKPRPIILVSCRGHSSPFPYADLLMELLRGRFSKDYQVLELPQAERIYDLLALYERAHCLVAVDSDPLHLARAVPGLPVIALTNDRPILWNGSPWAPQWTWCCRYHDWPERATEMLRAIEHCRDETEIPFISVWSNYGKDWPQENYNRKFLSVSPSACGRDSANVLNDPKRIPYLRDCLRMGLQRATDNEVVCLTRPDTRFTLAPLAEHWGSPCFSYRLTRNGAGDTFSPIVDMLAATKGWWKEHLAEIPDFLFGGDYAWSEALRVLFANHGAHDVTGVCYREATKVLPQSPHASLSTALSPPPTSRRLATRRATPESASRPSVCRLRSGS